MTQTILNKAFDGLAMASLTELAAQLHKANMHTSAGHADDLASDFQYRLESLAPLASITARRMGSSAVEVYGPADPIMYDLERCAVLAGMTPDLAFVEDLIVKLRQKDRIVAVVWVEYARDRIGQFHAAICALWDMASRLVPPTDQVQSNHPAIIGAYLCLNHLPAWVPDE